MRHLDKPNIDVRNILSDCADSYRADTRDGIRDKLYQSIDFIYEKSNDFDREAENHNWSDVDRSDLVNDLLSKNDMCDVYDSKFVKVNRIKLKYYDKIMSLSITGTCPICGIGHVSTLDHYLAKSIYPTYAVTPCNLIPVCRDCNFEKLDTPIDPASAPLHPYYDEIDSLVWLKAELVKAQDGFVAKFAVCDELQEADPDLFLRIKTHMDLYALNKAYAVQATTEIAENISFWRNCYDDWGKDKFSMYLSDSLKSKENFQKNTWKTALIRALINNVDIVNG